MIYEPTMQLRFVERLVPVPEYGNNIVKTIRVLQQFFESTQPIVYPSEWRDVPMEKEE